MSGTETKRPSYLISSITSERSASGFAVHGEDGVLDDGAEFAGFARGPVGGNGRERPRRGHALERRLGPLAGALVGIETSQGAELVFHFHGRGITERGERPVQGH